MNKSLKYFCQKCLCVKSARIVTVFDNPDDSSSKRDTDVIKTFGNGFVARKLECDHYVSITVPAFLDSTDSLSPEELSHMRGEMDRSLLNKSPKEVEERILLHVETYQTLLKISSKQVKQAKYRLLYLEQLKDKFSKTLAPDDVNTLNMKFAHFLEQRPTSGKIIEREKKRTEKSADSERDAIEAVKALFAKRGYNPRKIFGKKEGE